MHHAGSCHCGAIDFTVTGEVREVIDCNCSLCRRRGGLLWFAPRAAFSLRSDPGAVQTYTFHSHTLRHHFCATCGIAPYSEGTGPDRAAMVAINVRCLPQLDLASLTILPYDGAGR